jgi:hypothetical protein
MDKEKLFRLIRFRCILFRVKALRESEARAEKLFLHGEETPPVTVPKRHTREDGR